MSALLHAVEIQRHLPSEQWKAAIAALPEVERAEAREYLAGIWQRMQAARRARARAATRPWRTP